MSITELEALSRAVGEIVLEFLFRSCVLFAVGALALVFLRSRSAEIRHFAGCGMLYPPPQRYTRCLPSLPFSGWY